MKVAILADVHGNSVALREVIKDIQARGIREVILLGDYFFKGPDPKGVADLIEEIHPICCIKGNTEINLQDFDSAESPNSGQEELLYALYEYLIRELGPEHIETVAQYDDRKNIRLEQLSLLCVHGSPRRVNEGIEKDASTEDLERILKDVYEDIILVAHTHLPFLRYYNNKMILNPGAVGLCNRDGNWQASYAVLHLQGMKAEAEFVRVKYPHEEIEELAVSKDFPYSEEYKTWIRSW